MTRDLRFIHDLSFALNRTSELPSPVGYSTSVNNLHAEANRGTDPSLRIKRSWDLALGPIKQVPMNLFIMYMSGNRRNKILVSNSNNESYTYRKKLK